MRKLLMIVLLVFAATTSHHVFADIDPLEPGAFYIDNFSYTTSNVKKVAFKAWFSFPASFCLLRIAVPPELEITRFEHADLYYEPGEDFIGEHGDTDWELVLSKYDEWYYKNGNKWVDDDGKEYDIYHLIIYNTKNYATWQPEPIISPYKMFSLLFRDLRDDESNGKIGDIKITSYMVNYSNVTPWQPIWNVDDKGNYYWSYWYPVPYETENGIEYSYYMCGDINQDGDFNISDFNGLIDILLSTGNVSSSTPGYYPIGDVNLDGDLNIIDLQMLVDGMLSNPYYWNGGGCGNWFTGYILEKGHCTASVRRWYHTGDVNGDGIVDVADIVSMIDSVLGNSGSIDVTVADMNDDGNIDVADVVLLIDRVLNGG